MRVLTMSFVLLSSQRLTLSDNDKKKILFEEETLNLQ